MPSFQVFDDMFRVNLFRNVFPMEEQECIGETSEKHRRNTGETSEKHSRSIGEASEYWVNIRETSGKRRNNLENNLNSTQTQILELLSRNAQLSAKKMAETIGISSRNIEVNIKKLKKCGILIRHGSPKSGYWEIK